MASLNPTELLINDEHRNLLLQCLGEDDSMSPGGWVCLGCEL